VLSNNNNKYLYDNNMLLLNILVTIFLWLSITGCVEPGLVPHEGQSRSPMPEYPGPPVTVSYAGRDMDPAIRQPYPGQMRPTKPGGKFYHLTSLILVLKSS